MIAYHFTGPALRDGRPIPAIGEWLVHEGPVVIRESGLHASRHPRDALAYASGELLHRVECEDIVAEQSDKFVCRRRKIIATIDASDPLWRFARQRALSVIHLWDAPDVVREYLETGRKDLKAVARAAARGAAGAAEWHVARAAARAAAWAIADAAWVAASAAARTAVWAATWAAGSDVATATAARLLIAQERDEFLAMVEAAFA